MGCWNETCGVSQLPINYGDKVRLFVLHSQECSRGDAGGGTCYTTDRWTPMGLPVQGVYDDYGGIEKIVENDDSKFLLEILKERWVTVEDDCEKIPPLDKMTLKQALHLIERDLGKCKPYFKEETLGIMFVLEDVYQTMVNYNPIDAHYESKPFIYRPLREIYQLDIEAWYEKALRTFNQIAELEKTNGDSKEARIEIMSMGMKFDLADDRIFAFSESGRGGSAARFYRNKLRDMAKEGLPFKNKKVQKACKSVIEMFMFCNSMSAARKMWIPQCGKGGQHNDLHIYKLLNQTTTALMTARDKESEEDGCEPTDEEGYTDYMREHNKEAMKKHVE